MQFLKCFLVLVLNHDITSYCLEPAKALKPMYLGAAVLSTSLILTSPSGGDRGPVACFKDGVQLGPVFILHYFEQSKQPWG